MVDRPNLNHRHFALWITSLSYTSIAASTALVTTNPVWVALLSRFWFGEKLSKLSIAGIAVALGGTIAIALGSAGGSGDGSSVMLGNFLALAGSWAVSLYLLCGDRIYCSCDRAFASASSLENQLYWLSASLAILFEPVGASCLGYLVFGEVPGLMVLVGAGVLLFGVAIGTFGASNFHNWH